MHALNSVEGEVVPVAKLLADAIKVIEVIAVCISP
jgi:hypothetical protein